MTAANVERTLIRGAEIVDGTGAEPFLADVLVVGERIEAVGPDLAVADAAIVEARGRWLLPGFIDVHSHDDAALFRHGGVEPKLLQGVTTTVIGNCGLGCAPSSPALKGYSSPILGPFPDRDWATFPEYLDDLASGARRLNSVALVPHTPVRAAVQGMERRASDRRERARITELIGDALDAGAAGVSLGLMYAPGNAADPKELAAIARAVARHDRLLVAHVRNEADHLLVSLDEFASIARTAGAAMHISHLKVSGPKNFGRMPEVLDRLDSLRRDGLDVTVDVYPYEAGSTTVATLFPSWAAERGVPSILHAIATRRTELIAGLRERWLDSPLENYFASLGPSAIRVAGFTVPANAPYEGLSLAAIAEARDQDPAEALLDLVESEEGRLTVVLFQTDRVGMAQALAWPWTLIGSDGLPSPHGYVHPRLYGTFPRLLTSFAGPDKALSIAQAVRRGSRDSAHRFGLSDRGLVTPGALADLQLIDPATYADHATFEDPRRHPSGIDAVLVRGVRCDHDPALNAGRFDSVFAVGTTCGQAR